MESMMTARQVAELLGVHENWVYDQAASGELPSYKIGGGGSTRRNSARGSQSIAPQSDGGRNEGKPSEKP